MNQPASSHGTRHPRPSPVQQKVIDRIAAQRERLSARRAQEMAARALADSGQIPSADAPLAQRLAWFTREHPVAVAAVAAAALMTGPRRLVRWAGVALPLILKLRGR